MYCGGCLHSVWSDSRVTQTSYDYDAPIHEAGQHGTKYALLRAAFNATAPVPPAPPIAAHGPVEVNWARGTGSADSARRADTARACVRACVCVREVQMSEWAPLLSVSSRFPSVTALWPLGMEHLNQGFGCGPRGRLSVCVPNDIFLFVCLPFTSGRGRCVISWTRGRSQIRAVRVGCEGLARYRGQPHGERDAGPCACVPGGHACVHAGVDRGHGTLVRPLCGDMREKEGVRRCRVATHPCSSQRGLRLPFW